MLHWVKWKGFHQPDNCVFKKQNNKVSFSIAKKSDLFVYEPKINSQSVQKCLSKFGSFWCYYATYDIKTDLKDWETFANL